MSNGLLQPVGRCSGFLDGQSRSQVVEYRNVDVVRYVALLPSVCWAGGTSLVLLLAAVARRGFRRSRRLSIRKPCSGAEEEQESQEMERCEMLEVRLLGHPVSLGQVRGNRSGQPGRITTTQRPSWSCQKLCGITDDKRVHVCEAVSERTPLSIRRCMSAGTLSGRRIAGE